MERIHTLIDKLYQQKAQSVPPSHLLFTVQLLQQELLQLQACTATAKGKKIAVTLPMNLNFSEEAMRVPFAEATADKEVFVLDITDEIETEEEVTEAPQTPQQPVEYMLRKPVLQEAFYREPEPAKTEAVAPSFAAQEVFSNVFETVAEAPTLPQYNSYREVHHVIAEKKESLNDRLKENRAEVANLLKESPIKDLRKAIGINDRFVFVRELFRGDEAAYERSIKTINGFGIYSEAEYWIARELKHKMGWDDSSEKVQQFYSLVRRRFS